MLLPSLFFTSISLLPLGLGILSSIHHRKQGARTSYIRHLSGTISSGIITLLMLFSSLYGDDLSSSSTASLIFLFAPIYATIVYGIGYGLSSLITDKSKKSIPISHASRQVLLLPIIILLILMVGILKNSIEGNDSSMAYKTSNSVILMQLYNKSIHGEADSFSIPLGLAQNPNTPPEILKQLATHEHRAIRTHVAQHKATHIDVISSLQDDNSSCVRKAASKRLGVTN
jgi:hypothetical protein